MRKKILSDKAAAKISGFLLTLQNYWAKHMNEKLNRLSLKRLKTALIIFCIVSGGFSLYLLINAVVAKPKVINVQTIKVPQHIQKEQIKTNDRIEEELYQQIQQYKKYLDSTGEQISPGLRDSMRVIEELYHSQQK